MSDHRDEFLVAYDYGMGGLWAIVSAPSAAAITARYPELKIVRERPDWMTDDSFSKLQRFEVDADPDNVPMLRGILADRRDH